MSAERALRIRLRTLGTLHEAVGALRSLSAHHFRIARAALPAARAYRAEVEATLGALGGLLPPAAPTVAPGLIVAGADLGLCGDYSMRVAAEAAAASAELRPARVYCLGRRTERLLGRLGLSVDRCYPASASVAGLPALLLPLVDAIIRDRRDGVVDGVSLVAARFEGAGRFTPVRTSILPITGAPVAGGPSPSPYIRPSDLAAVLTRELLYVALYESFLDALAAEHGRRLMSAEGAWAWLGERIDAATHDLGALRRESSTQEVLEIATAARLAGRDGLG